MWDLGTLMRLNEEAAEKNNSEVKARLEKAERLVFEAVDALNKLTREANGLLGFRERELRRLFGNTNVAALLLRVEAAQAFLARPEVRRYSTRPQAANEAELEADIHRCGYGCLLSEGLLEERTVTGRQPSQPEVQNIPFAGSKVWPSTNSGQAGKVDSPPDLTEVYEAKVAEVILGESPLNALVRDAYAAGLYDRGPQVGEFTPEVTGPITEVHGSEGGRSRLSSPNLVIEDHSEVVDRDFWCPVCDLPRHSGSCG